MPIDLSYEFKSPDHQRLITCIHCIGKQEYSSRTLGATWGIISAVMVPIVVVLICIGWRILQRRKADEKEENNFMNIKRIDPDESVKMNSDDESIPYKKDVSEDSPEPTEPVKVGEGAPYTYGQPYGQAPAVPYGQAPAVPYNAPYDPTRQAKPYGEETEIN